MLLLKEMIREGCVTAEGDYGRFKLQLERLPADRFPAERKFNPLAMHPFMLHRALGQAKNYTSAELICALDLLLQCNRRLVTSGVDEALALQQTLVTIVGSNSRPALRPSRPAMLAAG